MYDERYRHRVKIVCDCGKYETWIQIVELEKLQSLSCGCSEPLGKNRVRPDGTKRCQRCDQIKPVSEFYPAKVGDRTPDGVARHCIDCIKDAHYIREYGITLFDFKMMEREQNGCCAICGLHKSEAVLGNGRSLVVDHDHETGKVRALLCQTCNISLGYLNSPSLCRDLGGKMAEYLEAHSSHVVRQRSWWLIDSHLMYGG